MPTFTFRITNYRCFGDATPLEFKIGPGYGAFVGPNDAGKSTVLRFFSELRVLWPQIKLTREIVMRLRSQQGIDAPRHVADSVEIFNDRNTLPIRVHISLDEAGSDAISDVEIEVDRNLRAIFHVAAGSLSTRDPSVGVSQKPGVLVIGTGEYDYTPFEWLFDVLEEPFYIPAFRNAINSGAATHYDLVLGTGFIAAWDEWKNGRDKRRRDAMVAVEEDIRKLLGYESLAINASPDKKELRVVVDGRSRTLSDMGAGVSELLLIIGNLFIKRPKTILIDEPETHLHPLKQLELLRLLLATTNAGVLLFATHSLGLARSVTRNITQIRRDGSSGSMSTPFASQPHLLEFLGEMNYTAQRELGAGTVFFVEGVTDVLAVRHFLRLYEKDQEFVLLPLLGDCLINAKRQQELAELSRLGVPCVALLDSERAGPGDPLAPNRLAFLQIWHGLGFKSHVLDRRALENYLPDSAVRAVRPSAAALGPFDKPDKKDKALNAAVALHMTRDDIDATDLGAFLRSL